jgi:hypothetical protein
MEPLAVLCINVNLFTGVFPRRSRCSRTSKSSRYTAGRRAESLPFHALSTAAWAKRRARPSRVHTKSTEATMGAKAAFGKAARAEAKAGAGGG